MGVSQSVKAAANSRQSITSAAGVVSGRVDLRDLDLAKEHWGVAIAREVIKAFPDQQLYTCAAGISPSGVVHFGNFRDVMTALAVAEGLRFLGKNVRLLFSWDDLDRFRKVPAGIPEPFREYIGRPLSGVPDPEGKTDSYARHFELPFEEGMRQLGIKLEYRCQTKEYRSGRYAEQIIQAIRKRDEIAETLLSNMSDKGMDSKGIDPAEFRRSYFPITVYSPFSGTDHTQVLEYDGESSIVYKCENTGKIATADLRKDHVAKLSWKIDWPMRWAVEEVNFEPGGRDHASPGGSFDSSGVISQLVYNRRPPVFVGYDFIGLKGLSGKMSGSKGGALTPGDLLKVYEPAVLKWLYTRRSPAQAFNLAFDTDVYRVYDEFDREVTQARAGKLDAPACTALTLALQCEPPQKRLSFRQLAALGQIVQWDVEKLLAVAGESGATESRASLCERLDRARGWLEDFRPEEMIQLRSETHREYLDALSTEARSRIEKLHSALADRSLSSAELDLLVYAIPKDPSLTKEQNAKLQRAFFVDVYQLLLGSDTGPRLSTFLWAADREKVRGLLSC